MNLKIAIIGLPNAGKSTLFNALLKRQVADTANYPFTTIEPNIGVVPVPDERLEKLAGVIEATEGKKPPIVPAVVEFVDIAGLVKGASEGQGLGNKFLAHIREAHLIVNVLRYFPDPTVVHVVGSVDPQRDKEIIETELILADLQTLAKQVEPRGVRDKTVTERWAFIKRLIESLNKGNPARAVMADSQEYQLVRDLNLLSLKPILYVANVSEHQLTGFEEKMLKICAKIESELSGMNENEQAAYLLELGLASSGLDRLIAKSYELLGLISFLTAGVKEIRAWTIAKGTCAQEAAGVIHTDFAKKFIRAEIIAFTDFVTTDGWLKARQTGKVRSEGRDYQMHDGDVVEFKIGS